jgi:hypothetical protein
MTHDNAPNVIDAGAITIWIATLANILPSVAALLSIVWFMIRIAESKTVQKLLGKYAWIKENDNDNNQTGSHT